jgi:hypothetical protein
MRPISFHLITLTVQHLLQNSIHDHRTKCETIFQNHTNSSKTVGPILQAAKNPCVKVNVTEPHKNRIHF